MSKLTLLWLSAAMCWPVTATFAAPLQAVIEPAAQHHHHAMQHQQGMEHHQHQAATIQVSVVPAPTALADLMPAAMVPLQDWRQANQQVLRLGGWQFYLQEAAAVPATPHTEEVKEQPHAHH